MDANGNAMWSVSFDDRIFHESKPVNRHHVGEIQSVSQNDMTVARETLWWKTQQMSLVLGLRHRQIIGR
jgi:hypothetical protein